MIGRANPLASYSSVHNLSKNSLGIFNNKSSYNNSMTSAISERLNESKRSERELRNQKLREKIRGLTTEPLKNSNPYSATVSGKANGYLDLASTYEKKAKSMASSYKYNYKDVSTRIQRAKTSVSAGQAVIAAKRKVVEIKRKLSLNVKSEDNGQLQAALIHAERMEMAAVKKKHHLEQEELVSNTMKRDESMEKFEEASKSHSSDSSSRVDSLPSPVEEEITKAEDVIFDERYKMLEDVMSELENMDISNLSEEMLEKMNEMIASFGEDELQMLEEAMEMAELMEVVDPHMSKEDFENLKRKHRASEERAMMKADMDYLKAVIKMNMEQSMKSPSGISAASTGFGGSAFSAVPMAEVPSVSAPAPDMSVDIAL